MKKILLSSSMLVALALSSLGCSNTEVPPTEQWRDPAPGDTTADAPQAGTPSEDTPQRDDLNVPALSEDELAKARADARAKIQEPEDTPAGATGYAPTATAYARLVIYTQGCTVLNIITVDVFPTGYTNERLAAEWANFAAQQHFANVRQYVGSYCPNDYVQGVGSASGLQHGWVVATNPYAQRIADYPF